MKRSPFCDFCVSAQPGVSAPRLQRLGRQVSVCARHVGKAQAMTRRQRETVARRMMRLAAGGGA